METNHLLLNHPALRLVVCFSLPFSSQVSHTAIWCKRISWMVAQTMAKQLVSVVNTSIWEVALPDIAEETRGGSGRVNMPLHGGRELVKRQEVLLILRQA